MSGYDFASVFPHWAGVEWQVLYFLDKGTAWHAAWDDTNIGRLEAIQGIWPGDTRSRWIWPHDAAVVGGSIQLYYWDIILGDGQAMFQADFNAGFEGPFVFTPATGLYTRYH